MICVAQTEEWNCLSGHTRVITRHGTRDIRELAGGTHEILTTSQGNGTPKWVRAPFRSYGVQPLLDLVLVRSGTIKTIQATPDHRWLVQRRSGSPVREMATKDLREGMRLKPVFRMRRCKTVSSFGVAHGFTYGDGHFDGPTKGCSASMCGPKDEAMMTYFPGHAVYEKENGVKHVSGLPAFFKSLPDLGEAVPYLLGWLAGYFAADGCVDKTGRVSIASADYASLQAFRDIGNIVGVGTYGIRHYDRIGIDGKPGRMFQMTLREADLFESFFVLPKHRARFVDRSPRRFPRDSWIVSDVEDREVREEVYCAEVPNTHTFALEDNILTGNCFAACLASLFELPIEELPVIHPGNYQDEWDGWYEAWQTWLAKRGLTFYDIAFNGGTKIQGYTIGTVYSQRLEGQLHSVVCKDGVPVWDPQTANERSYRAQDVDSHGVIAVLDPSLAEGL